MNDPAKSFFRQTIALVEAGDFGTVAEEFARARARHTEEEAMAAVEEARR